MPYARPAVWGEVSRSWRIGQLPCICQKNGSSLMPISRFLELCAESAVVGLNKMTGIPLSALTIYFTLGPSSL